VGDGGRVGFAATSSGIGKAALLGWGKGSPEMYQGANDNVCLAVGLWFVGGVGGDVGWRMSCSCLSASLLLFAPCLRLCLRAPLALACLLHTA
jgi:hypothetical protein